MRCIITGCIKNTDSDNGDFCTEHYNFICFGEKRHTNSLSDDVYDG